MSMEKFLKSFRFRNVNQPDKGNRYYAVPIDEKTGIIERVGEENIPYKAQYRIMDEGTISVIMNSPFQYAVGIFNPDKDLEFEEVT